MAKSMANAKSPVKGGRPPMKREKGDFKVIGRLLKILFKNYKVLIIGICTCLVFSAISGSVAGVFLENIYKQIDNYFTGAMTQHEAWANVIKVLVVMLSVYAVGWVANFFLGQLGATLTQRYLRDLRNDMFDKMQRLPIRYFDRTAHGDIMSIYTNDVDAIRQLISQSIPQLIMTMITLITLTCIMLYFSVMLWAVVVVGVIAILFVTKRIGGKSAKYFLAQQKSVGKVEGFIEEAMNGQKVVKVFCHEEKTVAEFDKINGELCDVSYKAHGFSNMLMPIIHNIGNIMYVVIAFIGCIIYILTEGKGVNISFEALFAGNGFVETLTIPVVVAFLGMARQFANQMGQISNQINSVVMAMAGASRVFGLLDEKPEEDNGYVTLVNAKYDENGNLVESKGNMGVETSAQRGRQRYLYAFAGRYSDGRRGLRLRRKQNRTSQYQSLRETGSESRVRRRDGRGQDDDNKPYKQVLRHSGRKNSLRRNKYQQDKERRFKTFARNSFAGRQPVYGNGNG